MEAAAFFRTPRNSDQNAYDTLVKPFAVLFRVKNSCLMHGPETY